VYDSGGWKDRQAHGDSAVAFAAEGITRERKFMQTDISPFTKMEPPWVIYATLAAESFHAAARQSIESWFDSVWQPFWTSLNADAKAAYLEYWNASQEWRKALDLFEWEPVDMEEDARESEEYLAKVRSLRPKPSWWRRILGRTT
jgi:hypothetical protein